MSCIIIVSIIIHKRQEKKELEKLKILEEIHSRKNREKERERKKKEIVERQFILDKNEKSNKSEDKTKQVLEDMCVLGSIMKEEIIEEKKRTPEKFISIEEATKEENKDKPNF